MSDSDLARAQLQRFIVLMLARVAAKLLADADELRAAAAKVKL